MKKKILIIIGAIFSFFVLVILGCIIFYFNSLKCVDSSNDEVITFVVSEGESSKEIINDLKDNDLIKNKYVGYIYIKFNKVNNLQAGTYELKKSMDLEEIIDNIKNGNVLDNSVSVLFVEGKRLTTYVGQIADTFGYSEEEILEKISDKEYLKELINDYWFLTDEILNDNLYYALEGYLYPSKYFFDSNATIDDIIRKMLDATEVLLDQYKDEIASSSYSVHEIMTMASIVELEGANSDDRKGVAGVFYNRLEAGWSLGSDVTTYYGARVEMSERDLYQTEIDEVNDYNTRSSAMAGKLPIGPICSPGSDAILASLEPEEHDYFFFVADKNKKTYFSKTNEEHEKKIAELKEAGLWYVYQ